MRKSLVYATPLVLALGLAACDTEDYEGRITELEGQLTTAQTEAETLRGELETSRARIVELEEVTQAEVATAAPDAEQMREPMQTALSALAETEEQLEQLEQVLQQEGFQDADLTGPRQNLRQAGESIAQIAQNMKIELETIAPEQ